MTIIPKDNGTFTYKKKSHKYGELSLNLFNYYNQTKKIDIPFIKDFRYSVEYTCVEDIILKESTVEELINFFEPIYQCFYMKFTPTQRNEFLKQEKIKEILQHPYSVTFKHNVENSSFSLSFAKLKPFLIYDFFNFFRNNNYIRKCKECNSYMLIHTLGGKVYCSETCRTKHFNRISRQKTKDSPLLKKYELLRKRYFMRTDRNPDEYPREIFDNWNKQALNLKRKYKEDNENNGYAFEEFLNQNDPFL